MTAPHTRSQSSREYRRSPLRPISGSSEGDDSSPEHQGWRLAFMFEGSLNVDPEASENAVLSHTNMREQHSSPSRRFDHSRHHRGCTLPSLAGPCHRHYLLAVWPIHVVAPESQPRAPTWRLDRRGTALIAPCRQAALARELAIPPPRRSRSISSTNGGGDRRDGRTAIPLVATRTRAKRGADALGLGSSLILPPLPPSRGTQLRNGPFPLPGIREIQSTNSTGRWFEENRRRYYEALGTCHVPSNISSGPSGGTMGDGAGYPARVRQLCHGKGRRHIASLHRTRGAKRSVSRTGSDKESQQARVRPSDGTFQWSLLPSGTISARNLGRRTTTYFNFANLCERRKRTMSRPHFPPAI
ncbi:hypothetical protein DFH27DRAFT_600195 [Peziza echinospora]|nr:hypothetical protein DFH27DRAFT_600195 [Peziza echinospora]